MYTVPTSVLKWGLDYPDVMLNWNAVFVLPFKCTTWTKLQSLQFTILHRYYPCNRYLYMVNIKDNDRCELCGETDDLEHYFYFCITTRKFWRRLEELLSGLDIDIKLTLKIVLFGLYEDFVKYHLLNFILVLGKQYISNKKKSEQSLIFTEFFVVLRNQSRIEHVIAVKNNKLSEYNTRWKALEMYM